MAGSAEQRQPPKPNTDQTCPDSFEARPWELRWYDHDAGRIVRPYTVTSGRTRPTGEQAFDLIAVVTAVRPAPDSVFLAPEQAAIVEMCAHCALTVADIGSATELPLGVVRVLLGDLEHAGFVHVERPDARGAIADKNLLREVINGLHVL
ncbi:DUF742 domain-containing protein [Streptomyces sp. NPDC019396]|uniref:DUF742 domain-containing protein n=1 Tax=Streptomyces sp. NPDC019396 TaxID=3154687 RepID=UPI0033F9F0D3